MPSGVHNATHLQNWHPERSRASVRPYEIVILSGAARSWPPESKDLRFAGSG